MLEYADQSFEMPSPTMPIYEYRCNSCRRKSSRFLRTFSDTPSPVCDHCGHTELTRVMSTFAVHVPWDSGINIPSWETMSDSDDNDANSQAEWARGMRRDMGDSFGREIDEMIQQADPSAMGGDDSGGGFDF